MKLFLFRSLLKIIVIISLLTSSFAFFGVKNAEADGAEWVANYDVDDSGNNVGYCKGADLVYDPIASDTSFDWDGSVMCFVNLGAAYVTYKGFSTLAGAMCPGTWATTVAALSLPIIGDLTDSSAKAIICSAALAAQNYVISGPCCPAVAVQAVALASVFGVMAAIWGIAESVKNNTKICGYEWNDWDVSANSWSGGVEQVRRDSYKTTMPDMDTKEAREYIFGGMEYEDKNGCKNPWEFSLNTREKILGYKDDNQKYYMKGQGKDANYACDRFLLTLGSSTKTLLNDTYCTANYPNDEDACYNKFTSDGVTAYECCVARSQNTVCIEDDRSIVGADYKFCQYNNGYCSLKGISYEIFKENSVANTLCARTRSLCPYNHNLGGGTTGGSDCDYLKHCSKIPNVPYMQSLNQMTGEYISSSCYDLEGDSQNKEDYDTRQNLRHFSAPIAQCFYETLYNIFMHEVGNISSCFVEDPDNLGSFIIDEDCDIAEGDVIEGESFFQKIQNNIKGAVKLALALAIMMIGIGILIGNLQVSKKDLMLFMVKMGMVMYFALGTAWQTTFFNGIYGLSNSVSGFMMNLNKDHAGIIKIDVISTDGIIITVEDYRTAYQLTEEDRDAYVESTDGRNLFKINHLDEYPSVNNKWFQATNYQDIEAGKSDNSPGSVTITANVWIPDGDININDYPDFEITDSATDRNPEKKNASISIYQKMDGCQFPKYNANLSSNDENYHLYPQYPFGKDYLAIWDTLDCKISAAIGQTPGFTVPALFMLMIPMIFYGPLGIFLFFSSLIFVIYLISLTIMALHIFIISSISIVILVYISPITITFALFKKTKNMFDKWWKYLLSFALQPVILFAYLGVLIMAFDTFVAGEGIKWGQYRDDLNQNTGIGNAALEVITLSLADTSDTDQNSKGIIYKGENDPYQPKNFECKEVSNSMYCVKETQWDTYHIVGLKIPYITDFSMTLDLEYLIKAAFLMFIFTQFLSKITELGASLTEGKVIKGETIGVASTSSAVFGGVNAVGTRATQATKKVARATKKVARGIYNKMRSGRTDDVKKQGSTSKPAASDGNRVNPAKDSATSKSAAANSASNSSKSKHATGAEIEMQPMSASKKPEADDSKKRDS